MTKKEAIEFFGSPAELAKAIGVKAPSIYSWGKLVPIGRQYQIEKITKGRLKASEPADRR